ncbi:bifunctional folylpolyglutamate synthase/dihydrofolate synthase [Virgibacillus alimentarius]|uniref:bifunctional folylpolyglutamate synthase/dihydrofolate synthase n=1 Tax=Virgibacillus alimentarius TaxID=698769 RepID=UPI00049378F4|nr:folylpolyglutamate synthase/dihydrofolate synthase family protein [Virgibacillus alimentarius]
MFETIQQVEDFFEYRRKIGIKPGLERMRQLLELVGNPQEQIQAIHIAGTNGKGSTLSYLDHALRANSYLVGVFTSPSLTGLCGYMKINDRPISENTFITILNDIYHLIQRLDREQRHPSEFEIITVIAFLYFAKHVDIALIEAGMGGREDTTNCIQPIISIITNVAKDHTVFLGNSIKEIAHHKAGIIKSDRPVIIGDMHQDALKVIKEEAVLNQADLYQLGVNFTYESIRNDIFEQSFMWRINSFELQVHIQMQGEHQLKNVSIAIMALVKLIEDGYSLQWNKVLQAMRKTVIAGRFEIVHHDPMIIVDGAHNPAGVQSFLHTVNDNYENMDKHLIFAAFKDKDLKTMLDELHKHFISITLTSFDHPRAASTKTLYELTPATNKYQLPNWKDAIKRISENSFHKQCYFVTGSIHFISLVRTYFQ